ncbi:NUDIX hydrolase [Halobacillus litoralis]|uniref:NUDIX hydrolase n=1 Tax=Halobacillus litoralis TaxID=45668 RepID=UPI001CFF3625|nr:NUDIX domain-containing protein [Halobacillus litoralis]
MNDYIAAMRSMVGHETLLTVGCGAIIEDEDRLLLQKRTDYGSWGIPGGLLELGETFDMTVRREVEEETGLHVKELELFGIYSGEKGYATYENGDRVFSIQIIFRVKEYQGELKTNHESLAQGFFCRNDLPEYINPHQAPFINDWAAGLSLPIIR